MMIEKKYNLYSSVSSEVYRELYLKYVEESQSPELMREILSLLVLARMRNVENIQEKAVNLLSSSYEKLSEKDLKRLAQEYYLGLPRSKEEFKLADEFEYEISKANKV
tara:strand:- start:1133 stop:1456 length:324 start_codon:yes stop_codon:yes gene_type:complete